MTQKITITVSDELYNDLNKHNDDNPDKRIRQSAVCQCALREALNDATEDMNKMVILNRRLLIMIYSYPAIKRIQEDRINTIEQMDINEKCKKNLICEMHSALSSEMMLARWSPSVYATVEKTKRDTFNRYKNEFPDYLKQIEMVENMIIDLMYIILVMSTRDLDMNK